MHEKIVTMQQISKKINRLSDMHSVSLYVITDEQLTVQYIRLNEHFNFPPNKIKSRRRNLVPTLKDVKPDRKSHQSLLH